jgi:hypothetical protein
MPLSLRVAIFRWLSHCDSHDRNRPNPTLTRSVKQGSNIAARLRVHHEKFWFRSPIVYNAAYIQVADKRLREQIETILIKFLKSNAVINKQQVERDKS